MISSHFQHFGNNEQPYTIRHHSDPIIAPLSALFNNLNLDNLRLDNINIRQFVYHPTPSLLTQFLNEQGYNLSPSTFESLSTKTLRHIFKDSKLCIYLKRKLEKPTHKYSISHFVHDEYFKNNQNKQTKNNNTVSVLSPSINSFCTFSNHSNQSPTTHISPSLSSQFSVPKNTQILNKILRGILMAESKANYAKNEYVNTQNGKIKINDAQLKKECIFSTKFRQKNGEFEFEEYAKCIFQLLRIEFDLKAFKYLYKLFGIASSKKNNKKRVDAKYASTHFWKSLITNSATSFFFRSKDKLFIIKALKEAEMQFLRHSFLAHYFRHIMSHKDSLLAKICGVYRIDGIYFMVMKNVLFCERESLIMHKIYDLKGSTHKRRATRHKLVLDENDWSAMNEASESQSFLADDDVDCKDEEDDEEEEVIDGIRHRYSPSWYQPRLSDLDLNKVNVIKSDTLKRENNVQKRYGFTFDGIDFDQYNAKETRSYSENMCGSVKQSVEVWKRSKILKDLDWIQDGQIIKIGKIRKCFLLGQFDKDFDFLVSQNVMDYSFLIGIHFKEESVNGDEDDNENDLRWTVGKLFNYEQGGMCYDRREEENENEKNENVREKNAIYFVGIIDFLQVYTAKKKVETFVKGLATDKNTVSCIDPQSYAKRLFAFIERTVE